LFEKTINKPARVDLAPIRISEQLRLEKMDTQFERYITDFYFKKRRSK
jgi:hypothetical protein